VLLAMLFRLSSTFALIANTQRELRRAIHHLGERRSAELGTTIHSVFRISIWLLLRKSAPMLRARLGPDDLFVDGREPDSLRVMQSPALAGGGA
jgi:hypothetical protein